MTLLALLPAWQGYAEKPAGEAEAKPEAGGLTDGGALAASLQEATLKRVDKILADLQESNDDRKAVREAEELFDQVIRHVDTRDVATFIHAAYGYRITEQLRDVDRRQRAKVVEFLRKYPALAYTIAFQVDPRQDRHGDVYQRLLELEKTHGKTLANFPALTAALCVVYDNESDAPAAPSGQAPTPAQLFSYYTKSESKLYYPIRKMPAELLVYLIDVRMTPEEMLWAMGKFQGNSRVGRLFHRIRYDDQAFERGAVKQVDKHGYNLPNLMKWGGICVDQAHFAVSVGKAIGVPTVTVVGKGAGPGHAWVGYLESRGRTVRWNFEEGRFGIYEHVQGLVRDPQTGRMITDNELAIQASAAGLSDLKRQAAVAFYDAHRRLAEIKAGSFTPEAPAGAGDSLMLKPRENTLETQMWFVEQSLGVNGGYLPSWNQLREAAKRGDLTGEQKQALAAVIEKLAGRTYPDFVYGMLEPMIRTEPDAARQASMWDSMYSRYIRQRRPDLAARAAMELARLYASVGEHARALKAYERVIQRLGNDVPQACDATREAGQLMQRNNASRLDLLKFYRKSWYRMKRPESMAREAGMSTNWYRVGKLYVQALVDAGEERKANSVERQLGTVLRG